MDRTYTISTWDHDIQDWHVEASGVKLFALRPIWRQLQNACWDRVSVSVVADFDEQMAAEIIAQNKRMKELNAAQKKSEEASAMSSIFDSFTRQQLIDLIASQQVLIARFEQEARTMLDAIATLKKDIASLEDEVNAFDSGPFE